jgi:hypothetical protein
MTVLTSFVSTTSAQDAMDTMNSMLDGIAARATEIAALTDNVNTLTTKTAAGVLAQVGDSIAAGYQASYGYVTRIGYGSGVTIANQYSITGRQVAQIGADVPNGLTSLYQSGKTNVMIFERGTNDIRVNGTTGAALYSMVASYISQYKSQGFYVAITTLLPYTDGQDNATTRQKTADYNALVRANSAGADAIIDFAADPTMGTYPTSPNDTTLYVDKLHPTNLGQDKLAAIARPIVNSLLSLPARAQGPTLQTLTLSGTLRVGVASTGTISGATSGSSIASNVSGLTVNSSARTYSWSGTGTAATTANALVETLATATNSGKPSSLTVLAAAPSAAATFVGSALTMTSPTYATDDTAAFGQALTGGYGATAANAAGVLQGTTFAVAVRFKTTLAASTGTQIIVSQGDRFTIGTGSDGRLTCNISPTSGSGLFIGGGGFTGGGTLPVVADGNWHWVVLNVTGTGATIYLDGTSVGLVTQDISTLANKTPFGVRTHGPSAGTFVFAGSISEVGVFNANIAATVPAVPLSYSTANIVELWHLDGNGAPATA